jgi:hypothetical protein
MSQIQNQSIIQKVALAWHEYRRQSRAAKRYAKAEYEQALAEIELLQDQIRAEGYDTESDLGRAMMVELLRARLPQLSDPYPYNEEGERIR